MTRSFGDMASPRLNTFLLAVFCIVQLCRAGPVGPLPNMTNIDMGLKEGSCALGDVVYVSGDDFPGSDPCEKCKCTDGEVECVKQECEPRPGCKALHRPDHCCPTYHCECEQQGRVYGNGEKLVDPVDPCRVCYCQGGEVVCRRIACFVRDDCTPRLVPGRCCPEYDNCPVRGVTALPGISSLPPSLSTIEEIKINAASAPIKENIKPEITIKEITPVSEIPVITEVKIKEILPSPGIEVAEYSSSKSPLIAREATSEKSINNYADLTKTEAPTIVEVHPSQGNDNVKTKVVDNVKEDDSTPSKISFSTQDSINSDIYPSNVPIIASPSAVPAEVIPIATTTKASMVEDDDFEHNPAFPPLPDDFSLLSNRGDEIVPEPSADFDHIMRHEIPVHSIPVEHKIEQTMTLSPIEVPVSSAITDKITDTSTKSEVTTTTEPSSTKQDPKLNLRSAIPTEILNVPSYAPEDIISESDDTSDSTTEESILTSLISSNERTKQNEDITSVKPDVLLEDQPTTDVIEQSETTQKVSLASEIPSSSQVDEQTTSSIAKSNIATEVTSQTELSSLPIETSDQKPHDTVLVLNDKSISTPDPTVSSTRVSSPGAEVITVSKSISNDNNVFENTETTEFILTSFGSSETATDSVELIKISGDPERSSSMVIAPKEKTNNALKDLINLVSDVASINDQTEIPETVPVTGYTSISDSEELIPVNAGYKSKSNSNQNSITEIPIKNKNPSKQKVVEIEDEDTEHITDSPAPNDKVEPTTRRPIIDNVSDMKLENKTEKKDIEIITPSYVPTINKRLTKVIMKKNNENPISETSESVPVTASSEIVTQNNFTSNEITTADEETSTDAPKLEDMSTQNTA